VADIRQQVEAVLFSVQYDSSLEKPEQHEGQGVEVTVSEQKGTNKQTERQVVKPIEALTAKAGVTPHISRISMAFWHGSRESVVSGW